jgi:hypothetical protein
MRKQPASLIIMLRVGQLGVLGGVLNVLMAYPILHKAQFSAGIKEVCGDGVLQTMKLPFLRRQARLLAIGLPRAL